MCKGNNSYFRNFEKNSKGNQYRFQIDKIKLERPFMKGIIKQFIAV